MDLESRTLDGPGRGYLVGRLRDRGFSLDIADRVVRMVFDEISQALQRGENVQFPFGYLKTERVRRGASQTVGHVLDEEGSKLLEGETPLPWAPGWSLAPDESEPIKKPERVKRRRQRLGKWA